MINGKKVAPATGVVVHHSSFIIHYSRKPMFGALRKNSRLGQWNGRRRASRGDEPFVLKLFHRPVLLRLTPVFLTAFAITYLPYRACPPFPYRVAALLPSHFQF